MPYLKKQPSKTLSIYRPISLFSCVGKLLEYIVFKYVYILSQ